MSYIHYTNTQAVALKLRDDLNKIKDATDIAIQVFFILWYLYSTIVHVGSIIVHIIYAVFLLIALGYFIFHMVTFHKIDKKLSKRIRTIIRYVKYPTRICLITLAIVEIAMGNGDKFAVIATALSVVAFFLQILVQLLIRFANYYFDLFSESLKMDYDQSDAIRAIYNAYKFPKKKNEDNPIVTLVKNKAVQFIEDNKDSNPNKPIVSENSQNIRARISDLKEFYNLESDEPVVLEAEEQLPALQPENPGVKEIIRFGLSKLRRKKKKE